MSSSLQSLWPWMLSDISDDLSALTPHLTLDPRLVDIWWNLHNLRTQLKLTLESSFPNRLHEYRFANRCSDILFSLEACLMAFMASSTEVSWQRKQEIKNSLFVLREEIVGFSQSSQALEILQTMV